MCIASPPEFQSGRLHSVAYGYEVALRNSHRVSATSGYNKAAASGLPDGITNLSLDIGRRSEVQDMVLFNAPHESTFKDFKSFLEGWSRRPVVPVDGVDEVVSQLKEHRVLAVNMKDIEPAF